MVSVKLDKYSNLTNGTVSTIPKGASVGESLTAGKWIYINSSGNVRLADSSLGVKKPTIGIIYKEWNNYVVVKSSGIIKILGWGLTPGSEYFLGSNGDMTTTVPTDNGEIVQSLGWAVSSTEFSINILDYLEN
jgi:hypothetical protein